MLFCALSPEHDALTARSSKAGLTDLHNRNIARFHVRGVRGTLQKRKNAHLKALGQTCKRESGTFHDTYRRDSFNSKG